MAECWLALGPAWAAGDLVFDRDGAPCSPNATHDAFDRAVVASGLPRITPHGMCHTMATMLLGAGIHPKIVQEHLGHRTIAMTPDRYSHVTMDMQKGAAAALMDLLSGPSALVTES
ncbi:MAG: tyrosine-type recombinase/integrase [Chloroflexota bacterium]|nr:tyrosine-type recombinase/integrase [Chloroflexota bacterium]